MPPEAAGIYDEEKYAKWLAYDKANGRIGSVSSSISIVISLAMLVMGWFGSIDSCLSKYVENHIVLY